MKSPFPGMDPYLEEHLRDIHHRFLTYACDELQEHLPRTCGRLEERVFVEPSDIVHSCDSPSDSWRISRSPVIRGKRARHRGLHRDHRRR